MTTGAGLIDEFLPRFDVREHHEIEVQAPSAVTYRAARELDLGGSVPVKALAFVRGIPHMLTGKVRPTASLTFDTALKFGFMVLAEEPGSELALGVVGRFWRLDSGIRHVAPESFVAFDEPGFAKAVMNFRVVEQGTGSHLETETRVLATDESSRRKFRLYWAAIGPFSGYIRHVMLRTIKASAEADEGSVLRESVDR